MSDRRLRHLETMESLPVAAVSYANVSNPPLAAELTAVWGTPPEGFVGVVDDNGAGANIWEVWRIAGGWWYQALTLEL